LPRILLLGDAGKAHKTLGWRHRTNFEQLVEEMVRADCDALTTRTGDPVGGIDERLDARSTLSSFHAGSARNREG
jgi:hypothetical protein